MSEPLNILVVDDDPATRQVLTEIMTAHDHQAVCAASAEEALGYLPLWTFQLAFLDQNLPGMDGLVVGEYLRRNNPDMVVALVTGDSDKRLVRKTRDLAIHFVAKPFKVGQILEIVDVTIRAAAERREQRLAREDQHFSPPIADFVDEIAGCFGIPSVPRRIEDRLAETIKRSLNNLRTVSRYSERDRVIALCGLLAASALDVQLPKTAGGRTLFEEYDHLMRDHGRRTEFGSD